MLGAGDSKSYKLVQELKPHGDVMIQREYCVNHAHKRMGTALKNLSKIDNRADKFQKYYRGTILKNLGNAIWASLFHNMSSVPTGPDSWCFYNRAINAGITPPKYQKPNITNPISANVGRAMEGVYTRMSDPNLLKRVAKEKTQNTNESFHGVVLVKVNLSKLDGAVARGVSAYNCGARQLTSVMDTLGVEVNTISSMYEEYEDRERLRAAQSSA